MKCKQDFYNESTDNLSKTPAFSPKSAHKPHEDHGCLQVFLISVEKELFSDEMRDSTQSNLSGEEWTTLRGLAANESVVRKGSDKGSSVVV